MFEQTETNSEQLVARGVRAVFFTALFAFLLFLISIIWLLAYEYNSGPQMASARVVVTIPRGSSVKAITGILGKAGIIHDDVRFILLARIKGVSAKIPAGEFSLPTGKTPLEILDLLVEARPIQHSVTVPEGLRIEQIARIFSKKGWCKENEYIRLAKDPAFVREMGFQESDSLEGYLFPDTYHLTKDFSGARNIIEMQVNRFRDVWKSVAVNYNGEPNVNESVTLASMVEKEAMLKEEMVIISAVFHNRLQLGMRLQSDPTVGYAIPGFKAPITKTHLRTNTPYNTYTIKGLPKGPIANPGEAALYASLFPVDSPYLFFVAKNDGSHQFSTNLKDHNRAVRKYQRKKKNKNGKE